AQCARWLAGTDSPVTLPRPAPDPGTVHEERQAQGGTRVAAEHGRAGADPDEDFRKSSGRSEWLDGLLGVVSGGELPVRILVVEDEAKVAAALKEGLGAEHHEVVVSATGEDGFFGVKAETFDLIVLGLMLPGRDGIEILSTLRRRGLGTPVLILTARDAVEDRVVGLDAGADDYLVKPFAFPELLARVRALLRRGRNADAARFAVADLELDVVTRSVRRGRTVLDLRVREFELLEYLLRPAGELVSRCRIRPPLPYSSPSTPAASSSSFATDCTPSSIGSSMTTSNTPRTH